VVQALCISDVLDQMLSLEEFVGGFSRCSSFVCVCFLGFKGFGYIIIK
jgi:hypothetical protein